MLPSKKVSQSPNIYDGYLRQGIIGRYCPGPEAFRGAENCDTRSNDDGLALLAGRPALHGQSPVEGSFASQTLLYEP